MRSPSLLARRGLRARSLVVASLLAAGAAAFGCSQDSAEGSSVQAATSAERSILNYATLWAPSHVLRDLYIAQSGKRISEAERAQAYLDRGPAPKEEIKARLAELAPQPASFTPPAAPHGELIGRDGSLFWKAAGSNTEKLIVDARSVSPRAISNYLASPDGRYVAYATDLHGSGAELWQVRSLEGSAAPADLFRQGAQGLLDAARWDGESKGIYYGRYEDPAVTKADPSRPVLTMHYRSLDDRDSIIFTPPEPESYDIEELDGNKTILAYRIAEGPSGVEFNMSSYVGTRRSDGGYAWQLVGERNRDVGYYLGHDGDMLLYRTDGPGSHFGVVARSAKNPSAPARTLIGDRPGQVLDRAQLFGNHLVLFYFDAETFAWSVEVRSLENQALEGSFTMKGLGLPAIGTISPFAQGEGNVLYMKYGSYGLPDTRISYDLGTHTASVMEGAPIDFDGSQVQFERTNATSADGTKIPVMLFTRKGVTPKGAVLHYYGTIGLNTFPSFDRQLQITLEMGGAFAIANIRGGGEKGADWYKEGAPQNHVVDDLGAAAKLVQDRFGVKPIATGRSYGGMHTFMAAASPKASLFSGFMPIVGVMIPDFDATIFGPTLWRSDFQAPKDENGLVKVTAAWKKQFEALFPNENLDAVDPSLPILSITMQGDVITQPNVAVYPFWDKLREEHPDAPFYGLEKPGMGHAPKVHQLELAQFYGAVFGASRLDPMRRPH